jgi:formamidopyrimidine-DNA glycosylase
VPELPEVEIAARRLRAGLAGRRIAAAAVPDPKILATGSAPEWEERLRGAVALDVARRAKYLILSLDTGETIVAHLRMTGKLVVEPEATGGRPRFLARLEGGGRLAFHDPRRFARLWRVPTAALGEMPELAALGPDALDEPSSGTRLAALSTGSRQPIKTWLMDQGNLGGLGNICAAEILFRVGLNPEKRAGDLRAEEWERLAAAIPEYLRWAIAAQWEGEMRYLGERGAENPFALYRRAGAGCPRCGTPIARRVIGGRGTYLCPTCQP